MRHGLALLGLKGAVGLGDACRYPYELHMSHAGLGSLDEHTLMVLFGTCHSRCLVEGTDLRPDEIVDSSDKTLYPAYFMTDLHIPLQASLESFKLWDKLSINVDVRRFGETILDSTYELESSDEQQATGSCIRMSANSLFIHDPAIYQTAERQVSAPKSASIRSMERLTKPPLAIQEAAKIRAGMLPVNADDWLEAKPYRYRLESGRDTSHGHPMMFAKYPQLVELAEQNFLRELTAGRASDRVLRSASVVQRKIFYYGNAFAGKELVFHTKGSVANCDPSLGKANPRNQYLFDIELITEIYDDAELLASSFASKVISYHISEQSHIQDSKRLFQPLVKKTQES